MTHNNRAQKQTNDPSRSIVGCNLLIPAFNEAGRIERCLNSVYAAVPLPPQFEWREWTVLDAASTDDTANIARCWSPRAPAPPLRVITEPTRLGKAMSLGTAHAKFIREGHLDDIVIVLDADVVVHRDTINALLAPFTTNPATAIVWGIDRPDDCSVGRWASSFQMEVSTELARRLGRGAPRAYGRLFAYRIASLRDFRWRSEQLDDIQLALFAKTHRLVVASAWDAVVDATPARGVRDFYLQTYRSYWASRQEELTGHRPHMTTAVRRARVGAVTHTASQHPLRAGAYVLARLGAAAYHRVARINHSAVWTPASSTKAVLPATTVSISQNTHPMLSTVLSKWTVAWHCHDHLRNWPSVMTQIGLSHVGWNRGTFTAVSRAGFTVQAPNRPGVRYPLIEVLAGDDYQLGTLSWQDPLAPRTVLDIGAHVGSFTCALASRLPGAIFTCVEPSAGTRRWLQTNLSHNGLTPRATILAAAVADSDSPVDLWEPEDSSCEASLIPTNTGRKTTVQGLTFAAILAANGGRADIVKLDCEGGEYAAILGAPPAAWESVNQLFLEYHPVPNHTFSELLARLDQIGMRLVWHRPDRRRQDLGMAYFARLSIILTDLAT